MHAKFSSLLPFWLAVALFAGGCDPYQGGDPSYGGDPGSGGGDPGSISGPGSLGGDPGGDGPVSVSGVEGGNYVLTRNPSENAHDYRLQQQGQRGPCGPRWDYLQETYNAWQAGNATHQDYAGAKLAYDRCIQDEGYQGGGAGGPE